MASNMADMVQSGQGGVEDELVGAAVQISELRHEMKDLKRAVLREQQENIRLKADLHKSEMLRQEQQADHQTKIERLELEKEDMKKNEVEAADTANKAYAEVKKRNVEIGKLTAALNEVKSTVVTAKAVAAAANRNPILSGTELSLQSGASVATSPVPSGGKSDIDSNSATNGRSRYAMDDAEGGVGQGEGVGQEQETEGGRRESGGFFGWLTGSARKKRRREE